MRKYRLIRNNIYNVKQHNIRNMNPMLLLTYTVICLLVAYIGKDRTLKFWGNFILSLLLSPVLGLLAIAFEQRMEETRASSSTSN
jgi:hypothetical protein